VARGARDEAEPSHLSRFDRPSEFQALQLALLKETLLPQESLLVVAQAARRRFSVGIVALTDRRVLYVQRRILRRPVVLGFPCDEIIDVAIAERPLSSVLTLTLADRVVRFDQLRPKERVLPLYWRIKERL
jgi:hypothetical protein